MTKEEVFEVVKKNIVDILPDVVDGDIRISDQLKDLGANSVDRADIVIQSMEDLNLKLSLVELGVAKNIEGLVSLFHQKLSASR